MRHLSKVEKDIIKEINSRKGSSLTQLLGHYSKEFVLEIDKKAMAAKAIIPIREGGKIESEEAFIDYFLNRLFFLNTLLKLLTYLEKEGYIVSYILSNIHDNKRTIGDEELKEELETLGKRARPFDFDDPFVIESLVKYRDSYVISTEELLLFQRNSFQTQEQIRFKKMYWLSWAGVIVAIIIGIFSFRSSIKPITINQNQIHSITTRLDSIIGKENPTKSTGQKQEPKTISDSLFPVQEK
ncbi:hypothetical protein [Prolixibacter sp. NT017]|uniref:hypothetical protein n=1 Tax=Prolixibacter sp. NT017 TaxID=2652390 RepID=UPI001273BF5C|nr:hypothetical protein [Prolixibacter sp. NT017]GET25838.1 hypothetical protein NT017_21670 [Prolixibacter sp. NT017]